MQVLQKESMVLFLVDWVFIQYRKYILTLMVNDTGNGGQQLYGNSYYLYSRQLLIIWGLWRRVHKNILQSPQTINNHLVYK